ncbi:SDR family NAD(P)-dependent oxidoreductase [Streptomyces sp. NPDC051104]|uniref:SDR family NAD(P)-dependent oxidoreductase n=1 Tax=Streptomyces sp. NPDC051104 TaxID=3155044 RepID=UPI0034260963
MPVAIITGASKGLGRALGAALARRGWDLVLDARTAPVLVQTAELLAGHGARVEALPGDVTDAAHRADLVAAARKPGGLDLGWTDLVVTPERGVRVVDGLLTGLHEPEASHPLMLEAVAGREAIDRGYEQALAGRYLWHEFGDAHLNLPPKPPHTVHCFSNSR